MKITVIKNTQFKTTYIHKYLKIYTYVAINKSE